MPSTPSITINLVDFDNLVTLIAEKKPAGGKIQIIQTDDEIIIRDKDGMMIGTLIQTLTD